jgi:MFS family permease
MDGNYRERSLTALLPVLGVVFVSFLIIGMAMPVLPLHVHDRLGLGMFVVGLVAGSQFAASLVSRLWAGRYADSRGAKRAVVVGLLAAVVAGGLYLLSLDLLASPRISVAVLLVGRAVLGAGESFIITGAQAWGLALAPRQAGKVIAWMGTAMYAAFALGAPLGTAMYGTYGFIGIAAATALMPLASLLVVVPVSPVAVTRAQRGSVLAVLTSVWLPGLGLAFSSFGFGAMTAFSSLLFTARGWIVWPVFTSFALAFISARLLLGHLADKVGGARVALVFAVMEALGLAVLWAAPWASLALVGAAITGFGYSLVYPAFGLEAIRRAPLGSRGLAIGAYTAFLDLALGLGSPALGFVGNFAGVGAIFLVSGVVVLGAAAIAVRVGASMPQRGLAPTRIAACTLLLKRQGRQ